MHRWRWRAAIGIAVLTMSCYDGVTGPGNQEPSRVAVTVTLPAATPAIWFPVGETLHLTVRRAGRTDAIVDTALTIADSLRGTVTVPLAQSIERFVATGEILYGDEVFFLAFDAIQLRAGIDTSITLAATYVGPGANAFAFALAPRDTALRKSDTTRLLPTVTDSLAQVIANVPVRYRSDRPGVFAVDSSGVVQALVGGRDTASIDGYLPVGLTSATRLRVVPTPTALSIVSGDGQTGPPGAVLPESLVVQLDDETGQPLSGATVHFTADAGSGAVRPDSATTDAAGRAAGQWTLGSTVGAQGVTASVEGRLTARFAATASRRIAAVVVTPGTATLTSYGSFEQFDAVAEDSSGAAVSGITFTWTSSDTAVASVSASGLATARANGTTTITATGAGVSGSATLTVAVSSVAAAVTVSPTAATLTRVNATRQFTAVATNAAGDTIAGKTFGWTSSDTAVATVNGSGVVTAHRNGTATISAIADGATGSAQATASIAVADVVVTPATSTLTLVGATQQLAAVGHDSAGTAIPGVGFTWTSSDSAVVTVAGTGIATALRNGSATISATAMGVTGTAAVTATIPVASIAVTPASASLVGIGALQQFTADARDGAGTTIPGITFAWSSSDQNVATIDAAGLATTTGIGNTTITATSGTISGSASLTVTSPACNQCSFVIVGGDQQTAPAATVLPIGLSVQLDNPLAQLVPGVSVTFTVDSGDGSVSPVTVTTDANGTATTTWRLGAPIGPQHVTVSAPGATPSQFSATALGVVRSVVVTPDSDTLTAIPSTVQLTAQALDSAGNAVAGKTYVWTTDNPTVATVDASGLVTAAGNGVATITATTDYVSGTATVVVKTGPFSTVATMSVARRNHTSTLLSDGTVLITGGIADASASVYLASAEVFHPSTGAFTATTTPMTSPRVYHTATRLNDGRVLLVGGDTAQAVVVTPYPQTAASDIYDPATGIFSAGDTLVITGNPRCLGRSEHTATLLPNGNVFVAGGVGTAEAQLSLCSVPQEVYDASAGGFTVTDSTALGTGQTATLLQNGKVLLVGGTANPSGAWLFDPATGTITATGSLNTPRQNHTATLLPDGRVLIAGGWVNAPFTYPVLSSAELYDPATGTFTPTGTMNAARAYHSAVLLQNGKVLLAGGTSNSQSYSPLASAELYDPATGQFTAISDMHDTRMDFGMTLLGDGRVLITGGLTAAGGVLATAELYTP